MDRSIPNGPNWSKVEQMDRIRPNWTEMDLIRPKWTNVNQMDQIRPKWTKSTALD